MCVLLLKVDPDPLTSYVFSPQLYEETVCSCGKNSLVNDLFLPWLGVSAGEGKA